VRYARPWRQATPVRESRWALVGDVIEIIAGVLVFGGLLIGLWVWVAILAVSQVQP
jgi:hypothetical protein